MNKNYLKDMSKKALLEILLKIIDQLDEADGMDFFGTEGWRHRFGFED
jgi:hypothetical protein